MSKITNKDVKMNEILIVFLYKLLKDLNPSNIFNSSIGKLLYKLILKRNLVTSEVLKEFIPNLELFLGNTLNFKHRLGEATEIVQRENFYLADLISTFLMEFNKLKDLNQFNNHNNKINNKIVNMVNTIEV